MLFNCLDCNFLIIDFFCFFFPADHGKGSHGVPGLYFKYDMSALKVIVKQDRENFVHFLVRISSVVAGIIVISGYLNSLIHLVVDIVTGKMSQPNNNYQQTLRATNIIRPEDAVVVGGVQRQNHLISNANQMADIPFNYTVKEL